MMNMLITLFLVWVGAFALYGLVELARWGWQCSHELRSRLHFRYLLWRHPNRFDVVSRRIDRFMPPEPPARADAVAHEDNMEGRFMEASHIPGKNRGWTPPPKAKDISLVQYGLWKALSAEVERLVRSDKASRESPCLIREMLKSYDDESLSEALEAGIRLEQYRWCQLVSDEIKRRETTNPQQNKHTPTQWKPPQW